MTLQLHLYSESRAQSKHEWLQENKNNANQNNKKFQITPTTKWINKNKQHGDDTFIVARSPRRWKKVLFGEQKKNNINFSTSMEASVMLL